MILVVAPNMARLRDFYRLSPIGGDKHGISVFADHVEYSIRGISADAVIFTDHDLQMPASVAFWLGQCFSNVRDLQEAQKIRKVIAAHTMGGEKMIQRYFKVYRAQYKKRMAK